MLAQVATSLLAMVACGLGAADYADARSVSRPRASVCNGYSEVHVYHLIFSNFLLTTRAALPVALLLAPRKLCSKSYGNVTIVGAHDSYAVGAGNGAL